MSRAEFSRPERVDQIGNVPRPIRIAADEQERAALARRFALVAVNRLEASFAVRAEAGAVRVEGRVDADVTQACSVTDVPIHVVVDEPVDLRFVADDTADEEVELDREQIDTVAYDGGVIDLGEAAAETMALALDPFPRAPDADLALRDAGVLGEGEAGPFSALAALKDKLGGAQSS